jgi:hypothetical protein
MDNWRYELMATYEDRFRNSTLQSASIANDADVGGNMGIGTDAPADKLHVQADTASEGMRLENTLTSGLAELEMWSDTGSGSNWQGSLISGGSSGAYANQFGLLSPKALYLITGAGDPAVIGSGATGQVIVKTERTTSQLANGGSITLGSLGTSYTGILIYSIHDGGNPSGARAVACNFVSTRLGTNVVSTVLASSAIGGQGSTVSVQSNQVVITGSSGGGNNATYSATLFYVAGG